MKILRESLKNISVNLEHLKLVLINNELGKNEQDLMYIG